MFIGGDALASPLTCLRVQLAFADLDQRAVDVLAVGILLRVKDALIKSCLKYHVEY